MDNPKQPRSENFSHCEFFPIEIVIEILSRMPVKALGRFTTVCKSWHSLITSEMFINRHLKNYCISIANGYSTSNQSPNIFLMPSYIKELEKYSYSVFSDNTFVEHGTFAMPMLYSWLELFFIGNSCNGIIRFTDQKAFFGRKVFLYNPSLKKMKVISHDCFADLMYDRRRVYSKLGFGFSEHNNELKVVRVHYVKDRNLKMLGDVPPQVEVYSLKADCWRRITANINCIVHHRSVSCKGAVYWLARRRDRWGGDTILSFNVANEVFCEIALPAESNSFIDGTILVFKGLLAFCKDAFSNRDDGVKCYELWVMMEDNVTDSWTKLSMLETDQPVSKVIGFTNSGNLILQMDCGMLASWDPLSNQLKILKIDGFLNHVDAAFVESLVLFGEESIASADAMVMPIGTSSSMGIMKPLDLPLSMGTCKIAIHGDDIVVRVASDVAMVDFGVNLLKNLCRRQLALVGIMARPQSTPLALQLTMQNYCLIVQQHHFDRVPQSLKDFLANPAICFMNIGTDKLHLSPFNLEKNGIQIRDLVCRALNKQNLRGLGLKSLAAEVGVSLDEFSACSFLDWKAEVFSEAELKLAIHHSYACYKIEPEARQENSSTLPKYTSWLSLKEHSFDMAGGNTRSIFFQKSFSPDWPKTTNHGRNQPSQQMVLPEQSPGPSSLADSTMANLTRDFTGNLKRISTRISTGTCWPLLVFVSCSFGVPILLSGVLLELVFFGNNSFHCKVLYRPENLNVSRVEINERVPVEKM